jgi:glyoxylase-like metal-dependent hydrolase (beta-lactamase superfamily II)
MEKKTWPEALPRPGNLRLRRLESISPWFEVYQVGGGTFALLEPYHEEEVISYLVLGTERAALIDTGMGIGNIQDEVECLTGLPVMVVNTHGHYDHVGDDHRFAEVWAFDDDHEVARIEQGRSRTACAKVLRPGSYLDLPTGFNPTDYAIRPAPVTRRLQHLEAIDLGFRTLTVYHTPGHSSGSICLLDGRDRLLFTGDTFYPGTLFADLDGSDWTAYLESLRYLAKLQEQVSHLCPGHNEAHAPKEMLTSALEAFEQIASDPVGPEVQRGTRLYSFEGFAIRLPEA